MANETPEGGDDRTNSSCCLPSRLVVTDQVSRSGTDATSIGQPAVVCKSWSAAIAFGFGRDAGGSLRARNPARVRSEIPGRVIETFKLCQPGLARSCR